MRSNDTVIAAIQESVHAVLCGCHALEDHGCSALPFSFNSAEDVAEELEARGVRLEIDERIL
jgi:hypothetical protein